MNLPYFEAGWFLLSFFVVTGLHALRNCFTDKMHQRPTICDPILQTVAVEISDICRRTTVQYDDRLYLPHEDSKQDGQMITGILTDCRLYLVYRRSNRSNSVMGTTAVRAPTKLHLKNACDEKIWYEKICFKPNASTNMEIS
jgi:hypothetical protein